jgi:hypothetical protein
MSMSVAGAKEPETMTYDELSLELKKALILGYKPPKELLITVLKQYRVDMAKQKAG